MGYRNGVSQWYLRYHNGITLGHPAFPLPGVHLRTQSLSGMFRDFRGFMVLAGLFFALGSQRGAAAYVGTSVGPVVLKGVGAMRPMWHALHAYLLLVVAPRLPYYLLLPVLIETRAVTNGQGETNPVQSKHKPTPNSQLCTRKSKREAAPCRANPLQ